jgi:glutaconate CoA-transferase, subunit B
MKQVFYKIMNNEDYTADEIMTVVASRFLQEGQVCFVGIGLPSVAANLARLTHAPNLVLIYESGPIDTKPDVLPLSIGDGELAQTATTVVSTTEIFSYWLQGGWIDVGFLGAAQVDKFANINTTVIGAYDQPKVRLPGAGGAPEIAASAREVLIILRQSRRTFVEKVEFITSAGFLNGGDERSQLGIPGAGPKAVITDLGVLTPDPKTKELILSQIHPGITFEQVRAATGWDLRASGDLATTEAPTMEDLRVLRDLKQRTEAAHVGRNGSAGRGNGQSRKVA